MSHASRAAHISNNSVAMRRTELQSRRCSRRRYKRFDSTILWFSVFMLAVILAILAAPSRVIPVSAQQSDSSGCCGKKPPKFPDLPGTALVPPQTYSTFSGQIAVVTGQLIGGSSVVVVDLKNENAGVPVDTNWSSLSSPPTNLYRHPDWANSKIGDVFGLTLDDQGNVYVTASTSYLTKSPVTTAAPGNVYRIDGTTGAVNVFASLPNQGPGLGNIEFSCELKSFYVTNFADGRIYQMVTDNSTSPPTAKVMSAFSPATGAVASGFTSKNGDPETGRDYSQFIPKNKPGTKNWGRPWGVKVLGNRLYYGLWRQDSGHHTGVDAHANEVWSVQLAGGVFVANSQVLEVPLPSNLFTNPWPITSAPSNNFSNPVSSISFSPTGDMLLAERSMNGDRNNDLDANGNPAFARHASRLLEYTRPNSTSAWTPLTVAAANKFGVGAPHPLTSTNDGGRPSCAGGGDYDVVGGLVWSTGDALHYKGTGASAGGFPYPPDVGPAQTDYIYGIQGLKAMTGGTIHNSLLIDLTNGTTAPGNKNEMGDVEIPCPEDSAQTCAVKTDEISCKKDGTGGYLFTFTVTNNTGKPVINVLLTPPPNSNFSITPQNPPLPGGVLLNGQSTTIQVTITGGQPGKQICFPVTLMAQDGPCCTIEVCPVLPNCCAVAENVSIKCNPNGSYSYVLSIVNTSPNTIQHIYLYPPAGVTMTPNYFAVSLAPGATFQTPLITITGAHAGSFCFRLSLHTKGMEECCSGDQCVTLPACQIPGSP